MKEYIKVLLILQIPLLLVLLYSSFDTPLSFELEQLDTSAFCDQYQLPFKRKPVITPQVNKPVQTHTSELNLLRRTTPETTKLDTTSQRILFLGDSMVEGLGPRMGEYAAANGHDLTYICWYSSNTEWWSTDTLRYYIRTIKPTYIMMTIGGNEQNVRNLKKCEENIQKILSMVGDIPYIWICTPAWKPDVPFNEIPKRLVGDKRFFDSRRLTFERSSDHCHPTHASARIWMDSIAVWMQSPQTAHPIKMQMPPKGTKKKARAIILSPIRSEKQKATQQK